MSNKGSNKNDKKDDDLELLLAPEKVDANTFVVFGASALGVALLPACKPASQPAALLFLLMFLPPPPPFGIPMLQSSLCLSAHSR